MLDIGEGFSRFAEYRIGRRGERTTLSLGSKKKGACRVWLVRCSLYIGRVARVLEIGVESILRVAASAPSWFAVIVVTGVRRVPAPSERCWR